MLKSIFKILSQLKAKYEEIRLNRRWDELRSMGMHLGDGVIIPMSTWIDTSHCFLISIGDKCVFGANCAILAHDAMADVFIDATRIAKVTIHEMCCFGMGTIILPGVEIGPRSIVGSGSIVTKDIPPESVAVGNPAKVICTLNEFLDKHQQEMNVVPTFPFDQYDINNLTPHRMAEMIEKLDESHGYITGGYTARERRRKNTKSK